MGIHHFVNIMKERTSDNLRKPSKHFVAGKHKCGIDKSYIRSKAIYDIENKK